MEQRYYSKDYAGHYREGFLANAAILDCLHNLTSASPYSRNREYLTIPKRKAIVHVGRSFISLNTTPAEEAVRVGELLPNFKVVVALHDG